MKNLELKYNNKQILPLDLQNNNLLDNIKIDSSLRKQYKNIFSYDIVLMIKHINQNSKELLILELTEYIKSLDKDKIYNILPHLYSIERNKTNSIFEQATFVCTRTSPEALTNIIIQGIIKYENRYIINSSYQLILTHRIWLTRDNLVNKEIFDKIQNEYIIPSVYSNKSSNGINQLFSLYLKQNLRLIRKNALHLELTPNIIDNLPIITGNHSYSLRIINLPNFNNKLLLSFYHGNETNHIIRENNLDILNFIDNNNDNSIVIRKDNYNSTFQFKNSKLIITESQFKFDYINQIGIDKLNDLNIGIIDLKTYSINNEGLQEVYLAGWKAEDKIETYYLYDKGLFSSKSLIIQLFRDIFNSKYYNYTYYTHDLSNKDYILIIDSLTSLNDEFEVKPTIKDDNELVSLNIKSKIKDIKTGKYKVITIKILDSNLLLDDKLYNLVNYFNCDNKNGYFPDKFATKLTLNYGGIVPEYKFYDKNLLSYENYKLIYSNNYYFKFKEEAIKHLKLDILALNEILIKFNNIIFNEYHLNITNYKTYSSLGLAIFRSNFYNFNNNKINIIKGNLETEIRKAYFGGIVSMNKDLNKINSGYFYDVVSHYPSVMLNPMPIGNPILSNDKNIENYFGFCYVKITPPSNLNTYLIPYRDKDGNISCPSFPFKGIYFSELLKESIKYGYKIECLGGIKFNKGYNIFTNFVNSFFNKRMIAKQNNNLTLSKIYKLILNSLYGRLGMKDIENKTVIVNKEKGNELLNKKNILLISELHDKLLIKYNENINKDLLNLVGYETNNKKDFNSFINYKQRGNPSAIHIAAAISAYSQLEMMKFKNINNNKLLYHDTDSLLMENELDNKFINSNKLGYLKLEHIITEGYFISPKFYAFINSNNELIKKTKGIDKDLISLADFKDLSNGIDKTFINTIIKKDFKNGIIQINTNSPYKIKGKK